MEAEILNYIKEARTHGLADQEIKKNLLDVGWDAAQVEDSFVYAKIPEKTEETPYNEAMTNPALKQNPAYQPQIITASSAAIMSISKTSQAPVINLSDTHFQNTGNKKNKLVLIIAVLLVVLAGLGVGGFFAYGYFFPKPETIWNKAVSGTVAKSKISTVDFKLNFSDPGFPDAQNKQQSFSVFLNGNAYTDITNTTTPVLNTSLTGGFTAGDLSVSKSFKALYQDQVLYADITALGDISSIVGQKVDWIKVDFKQLMALASSSPDFQQALDSLNSNKAGQDKIKKDLAELIANKQLITIDKVLGSETVSGVSTYHFQNKLDKQLLKDIYGKLLDDSVAMSTTTPIPQPIIDSAKQLVNNVIDKLEIDKFETWVGKKDFQFYKISIVVKFPGLYNLANSNTGWTNPLTVARAKARDAKRAADMRQLNVALELFYNDHNGYPPAINGQPQDLVPTYIASVPTTQTPSDGSCTDYYNAYWYTPTGTPHNNNGLLVYPSYEYTACLGSDTGSYKAGLVKMTPAGITDNLPCTDTQNCAKPATPTPDASISNQTGSISFDATFSDFGKKQTFTPPQNPFDVVDYIKQQMNPVFPNFATGTSPSLMNQSSLDWKSATNTKK